MDSFTWGPQFLTGIEEVDAQHHSLVKMINRFGDALATDVVDERFILTILEELSSYAQSHFQTEEQLMPAMRLDPRHIKAHQTEHRNFMTNVSGLMRTSSRDSLENHRSLFEYLVHWLAYHILGIDQNMARQAEVIKRGVDPEEAYRRQEQKISESTGPLLRALSGLFSIISARNKALMELTRTLEDKVQERTRELSKANEALEVISITDHLTDLPNRRFAMRQLHLLWEEAKKNRQQIGCLMIDADGFKKINDTYGHDAGDTVLQHLANELKDSVRSDDIVCRLGGDEFIVLMPHTTLAGALHLGEQIRKRVGRLKVAAGDGYWPGSVSIGVAVTTPRVKSIDELIKEADLAVYRSKQEGKNCVRSVQDHSEDG